MALAFAAATSTALRPRPWARLPRRRPPRTPRPRTTSSSAASTSPRRDRRPGAAAAADARGGDGATAGTRVRGATTGPGTGTGTGTGGGDGGANAAPGEVAKFGRLAARWWDARANPLVGMNPTRVRFMRDVVDAFQPARGSAEPPRGRLPLRGKRVLDIGCGGGLAVESFARLGASLVVGVDASPQVIEAARRHAFHDHSRLVPPDGPRDPRRTAPEEEGRGSIRYVGGATVEDLAARWTASGEDDRCFDVVTALEVVEHVPDPGSLLRAAAALLRPGGLLFVSTLNRTPKAYALAIVAAERLAGLVPPGTHDWSMFLRPEEVEHMVCRGAPRLAPVARSGMVVDPIGMRWSLDPVDLDVNWIGAYQKNKREVAAGDGHPRD